MTDEYFKILVDHQENIKRQLDILHEKISEIHTRLSLIEKYELNTGVDNVEDRVTLLEARGSPHIALLEKNFLDMKDRILILEQHMSHSGNIYKHFWSNFLNLITIIIAGYILYVVQRK